MKRRILASAAAILISTAVPALAAPTTWHVQTHLGANSSRSRSAGCAFATSVKHAGDLVSSCSARTGRTVATYTFHITGKLMGTPTFTVNALHSAGVKVTTTLTDPSAAVIRVTIVARGKGSENIRSVKISYSTC